MLIKKILIKNTKTASSSVIIIKYTLNKDACIIKKLKEQPFEFNLILPN